MKEYRIKCMFCGTPLCQLEETENWYCPKCRKWLTLSASRVSNRHYVSKRPAKRPRKLST